MIEILNAQTLAGNNKDFILPSEKNLTIDASHLLALPALIDPHVHFRTPGLEHKENWHTAAKAAIAGGVATVFDMPNTLPPTITHELLVAKQQLIQDQLQASNIPLNFRLFFGADKNHFSEIEKVKNDVIGIKVFMGCSTGNLVIDDDESLKRVFEIAQKNNLIVAVHAEDETLLKQHQQKFAGSRDYATHSLVRDIEVASIAVEKAIQLSEATGARLYLLHISSKRELDLIRAAKLRGLNVFAETTPHHLFLNTEAYVTQKGKAVVNPALRKNKEQPFLFAAIQDGTIDTIGSDHAPHTLDEKALPYGQCPSGMPGIEFTLPLLLNAYHDGKLSLSQITALTSQHAKSIFSIDNDHWVLVDVNKEKTVAKTFSKCGWTAYQGKVLRGWPVYTILGERIFDCETAESI